MGISSVATQAFPCSLGLYFLGPRVRPKCPLRLLNQLSQSVQKYPVKPKHSLHSCPRKASWPPVPSTPQQGPATSTEAHRMLPLHGISTEGGTLPATQGLTIEISCAVSVPGVGCVSCSDSLWSATLQHVCADLRKREAPSCPSEAAAALLLGRGRPRCLLLCLYRSGTLYSGSRTCVIEDVFEKVRAMHAVIENEVVLKRQEKSRYNLPYDYKEMLVNMECVLRWT